MFWIPAFFIDDFSVYSKRDLLLHCMPVLKMPNPIESLGSQCFLQMKVSLYTATILCQHKTFILANVNNHDATHRIFNSLSVANLCHPFTCFSVGFPTYKRLRIRLTFFYYGNWWTRVYQPTKVGLQNQKVICKSNDSASHHHEILHHYEVFRKEHYWTTSFKHYKHQKS